MRQGVSFLLALLCSSSAIAQPITTRNEIVVFRYGGSPTAVDQFVSFIRDSTRSLVGGLATGTDPGRLLVSQIGVDRLKVVTHDDSGPSDWTALTHYWKNTASLALFFGRIAGDGSSTVSVQSQIYLGDFHGSLPEPLALKLSLTADSAAIAKDSHSLAILYALAQQAQHDGRPEAVVATYLKKAYDVAMDLRCSPPGHASGRRAAADHLGQLCDAVFVAVQRRVPQ